MVGWPGVDSAAGTNAGLVSTYSWEVSDDGESGGEDIESQDVVGEEDEDGDEFGILVCGQRTWTAMSFLKSPRLGVNPWRMKASLKPGWSP